MIRAVLTNDDTWRIEFHMNSFSDIIDAFGGPVPFRDALGISDVHSRQMKLRDSIPAGYWPRTVQAAKELSIEGVTLAAMAEIASAKLEQAARAKAERVA